MSLIKTSSPFLRSFFHENGTIDTLATSTTSTEILTPSSVGTKRILVVIQNQSTIGATIQVIFNDTGDQGLQVAAGQLISVDNYNGSIRANASVDATPIHLAWSEV